MKTIEKDKAEYFDTPYEMKRKRNNRLLRKRITKRNTHRDYSLSCSTTSIWTELYDSFYSGKMKLTVMLLIYFCLTLIVFIVSLFALLKVYNVMGTSSCYVHFIYGADSVWQEKLLWNKNYPIIYGTNILIILFLL